MSQHERRNVPGGPLYVRRLRIAALLLIFAVVPFAAMRTGASGALNQIQAPLIPSDPTGSSSKDGVWVKAAEGSFDSIQEQRVGLPRSYQRIRLLRDPLLAKLSAAPLEFTRAARRNRTEITLPMPDGAFAAFRIEESPVMEPALAAQFPDVKTYRGQGVDIPEATARFDWTPFGLHAIILGPRGTVIINPFSEGDSDNYISFSKDAQQDGFEPPRCLVTEAMQASSDLREQVRQKEITEAITGASIGTQLRTYRLAIATTVEYTTSSTYGGSKSAALTKLGTIVNLINAIYEKEVSIHFNLVAGELNAIFDAEPDGLTNSNVGTMLNEVVGVLNGAIGSSNYDVGHAFGLSSAGSSSGVSQLSVVCGASKGRGASVLGIALVTGNFSIDSNLVAHEWGHEFSANHTFNSTSNFCGSIGQRNAPTAFEPGSGSTIMAYPGVCLPENIQNNSDNYFHGKSFDEIVAYSTGANGSCATITSTGNNPPNVSAGPDYTIPMGTPFALTAAGSDPDGDAVTYTWEEMDTGSASPPSTDDGTRPLFRSVQGTASPTRFFPKLSDILGNTTTFGESLPVTSRAMNFRVTAKDNRAAGGGVNSDAMVLTVTSGAGPFVVTQPNAATTWNGGSMQTVAWNIANTSSAPVSCANVKISLSTNGGNTFPIVLAAKTPNDGSEVVTVPNISSSSARIKVQAVGNVFFDISNANFTVTPANPGGHRAQFDFDGDGISDLGYYRAGTWGVLKSVESYSFSGAQFLGWGGANLAPIVADFDGDGKSDIAYIVPPSGGQSAAYAILKSSAQFSFAQAQFVPAGFPALGDTPIVADFDGDGKADPAIWRASAGVWIIPLSSTNYSTYIFANWGQQGDIPIVGDFDGDWKADIGFYRDGVWGVLKSSQGYSFASAQFFSWGGAGLQPIVADFDGDGKADIAYIVPPASGQSAAYSILKSSASYSFAQAIFVPAGFPALGDTPIVGDFDGDGKADPGIWRSSDGVWIIPLSSGNYGTYMFTQWGQSGDVAVPNFKVQF